MDKIWLKNYQSDVAATIDPNQYSSLIALFEESCRLHAKKIAYVNQGSSLTYAQVDEKSKCFALYLQSLGLEKGARVAIMLPNLLQYPIALFGILRAGCVAVNTNPLYTAEEVSYQFNDARVDVIIILANFAHTLEKALPLIQTPIKQIIVTEIGDLYPQPKRFIVNFVVKHVKKLVPSYALPLAKTVSFNAALKKFPASAFNPLVLQHEDLAFLQYTGGTTGISKGAMLTHKNIIANILQATEWVHFADNDIVVTALPLYHIFALTANCLAPIKAGATNILITNPRDIPNFIQTIKKSHFTLITGVSTLFNALLNHPKFKEIDFSRARLALAGGMALQQSVALRWHELTKMKILEAYGLTETSPAVSINPMYLERYNGSIGLPIPSTEISIRDEEGKELGINQAGELCVKGPQVMAGYWHRPEETAKIMTKDGFLKTGDIAKIDEKGFLYLIERKKDMIIVSGFNVYPNEVEQVISLLPQVFEVAVIGIPHEHSGEAVKACIIKRDESLTAEEVIKHCKLHLTAYKIPKIIEFYHELPKSNVGKILRKNLREAHA